jgi:putative phosphoesterase
VKHIGVISDTHGLLRPEAKTALCGCDAIVHAGDIGKAGVLDDLRRLAPLTAIRGNVDKWANDLPDNDVLIVEDRYIYVLHNLQELDLDPRAAGFDVVISGHSHQPKIARKDGVLYLNPGSAGPRRFSLPIALASLRISAESIDAEIVHLQPRQ